MPRIILGILIGLSIALAISVVNRPQITVATAPEGLPEQGSPAASEVPAALPASAVLSPAGSFDAIAAGLREDRPVVLWDALPASSQSQVESLIADCTAPLDAESWRDAFGAIAAIGGVLTTRPEFVRGNAIAMSLLAISSEDRSPEVWFRLGPLLGELGRSSLGDLGELAAADLVGLLESQGRTLSRALPDLSRATRGSLSNLVATRDRIAASRASEVRREDQRVLLQIESPERESEELWFVAVDDKWLPEAVTAQWAPRLEGARAKCAEWTADERLAEWLATLASVRPALSQLSQAESQNEFNAGLGSIAAAAGPGLAQVLLDSMLGSTGIQLNIGSVKYRAESHAADPEEAGR